MSGCAPFREMLSAELDGELQPGEEQELLAHLASCSACQVYRGRLKKTVKAIKQLDPACLRGDRSGSPIKARGGSSNVRIVTDVQRRGGFSDGLLGEVPTAAADVAARLGAAPTDPCEAALELISAQIDSELAASEEDLLIEHLAACSECQAVRDRLRRSVEQVRGANVVLLEVPASVFESLNTRLEAEAAAELEARPIELVSEAPPATSAPPVTPSGRCSLTSARAPAGRVIAFPAGKLLRWGVAAGILALAGTLAYQRFPQLQLALERAFPSKTPRVKHQDANDPQAPPQTPPTPPDTPMLPPENDPPPKDDPLPPDPVDGPDEHAPIRVPKVDDPSPEDPTDPPPVAETPGTRTHEPGPNQTRPRIELAALQRLHDRILSPRLAAHLRAELVEALGAARFDHRDNYRFLAKVLRSSRKLPGSLDRFARSEASRQAAFVALGRLGTVQAVTTLLGAPLRRDHYDADASGLLSALTALKHATPIQALAAALEGRLGDEHRYLIVEALGTLADPAGYEGLYAVLMEKALTSSLRREAALAMGGLADPRCLGPLLAGLKDTKRVVRQGSALALGSLAAALPEEDAIDCITALTAALKDKQPLVREAAVRGLALSRHSAAALSLVAHLETKGALRTRVRRALLDLGGPAAKGIRSPEAWRAHWEKKTAGPLPRLLEDFDPKAFRVLPSESRGVVFVIDTSGSMKANWPVVLYELKKALEPCAEPVRFQVIFFSDAPRSLWQQKGMSPASQANKAKALANAGAQQVLQVAKTAIGKALELALEHRGAETIYLISDGLETRGSFGPLQRSIRRLNVLRERPARIHTIHVRGGGSVELAPYAPQAGEPEDIQFMRKLAWENDGVYAHN